LCLCFVGVVEPFVLVVGTEGGGVACFGLEDPLSCQAATGSWSRPPDDHATMFLSQLPYLPLGDLRTVVSYPARARDIADERLRDVLTRVSLSHLRDRLDEEQDWAKVPQS